MNELFLPRVGAVLSADIAVPDHAREVGFYSRVLSTGEDPLWRADDLMNNLGMPIIGLGAATPEYSSLPLQWMPHIQVADVAASVERAVPLGGKVLMHEKDDAGNSQWAVLLDPNGAAFGLIPLVPVEMVQPASDGGTADSGSAVGRIFWLDLTIADAHATRDFYSQVVGWAVQDVEMKDGDARYADYNMLGEDGIPAAGVCHARGSNAGLPPVWMIYLPVGDLEESVRRVEEEDGTVLRAVRDSSGKCIYAAIQDPAGAVLGLTQA